VKIKINLLSNRQRQLQKQKNQRRYVAVGSFGALVLFIVFLVSLTVYALVLRTSHNNLLKQIDAQEKIIKSLAEVELKYLYLKEKVGPLTSIIQQTRKQQAIARYILQRFPDEIPLAGFSIAKKDKVWLVDLGGEANGFRLLQETLEGLIANPKGEEETIKLTGLTLNSLGRNDKFVYQFSLLAQFE